jgi:hypothetical protein
MKPIKFFMVFLALSLVSRVSSAQLSGDYHTGPYLSFLSSSQLKSSPGFGWEFGVNRQTRIGYRFEILNEEYIYYTSFGINSYTAGSDANGNLVYSKSVTGFGKFGGNYMLGVNFHIIPDKFCVNAAFAVAVNEIINNASSGDPILGTPPDVPGGPTGTHATELNGFLFDYGLNLGASYRVGKVQFTLRYFKGFANLPGLPDGTSATMNDLTIGIHFGLREFGFAKQYQNKLVK